MRSDVFYWKCDQALSVESKKELYFADKYSEESIAIGKAIVSDFLGKEPFEFNSLKVDGNHFAYFFSDGKAKFLLRTDDGLSDDLGIVNCFNSPAFMEIRIFSSARMI
jgi:hypothetical protein